jgi:hypothetical protein
VKSLGRHVSSGDPGAAGRNDDIDVGIGDPFLELRDDMVLLVTNDPPRGDAMPGGRRASRVSETVSSAILTGKKGRVSSSRGIGVAPGFGHEVILTRSRTIRKLP